MLICFLPLSKQKSQQVQCFVCLVFCVMFAVIISHGKRLVKIVWFKRIIFKKHRWIKWWIEQHRDLRAKYAIFQRRISMVNINESKATTPLNVFQNFITEEILCPIVEEMNSYGSSKKSQTPPRTSKLYTWENTNIEEIRNCFAKIKTRGLVQVLSIIFYGSKKLIYKNAFILSLMPRCRFSSILHTFLW